MPLILTPEEAENRFQISQYDPINNLDHNRILLFDEETNLSGDLNSDMVIQLLADAGEDDDTDGLLIVVNGNLHVNGDIVFDDYRPCLLVLGNVYCHVLRSGDESMHITGDAVIQYAYYGYYNDGSITINGTTKVPYVLNSDHHSQINPVDAVLINIYSDYDDFFEYDFTAKDLPEVLVPEVLDDSERMQVCEFINLLKAGQSPFLPGAKTPRQVADENLDRLVQENPLAVTELDLTAQKFKVFPTRITALKNLQQLYLSKNPLKGIPDEIGQLEQLEELYLNDCDLDSLPAAIGNLKNLRILEISQNSDLTELPGTIGELQKLRKLVVDYIPLKFSNAFQHLDKLEEISMYSCYTAIDTPAVFPAVITQLKGLRKLDLRKNHFQELPAALAQLPLLEEIHWRDTTTTGPLPDFTRSKSLKTLVISGSYNKWKDLVFEIATLEHLQIDRNKEEKQYFDQEMLSLWMQMAEEDPVTYGSLADMIKEKQLEPDGRYAVLLRKGITAADLEGLAKLPHLKYLDLSFNNLPVLPESVYGLSKLEYLNLEYNKLSEEEKKKIAKVFPHAKVML